MYSCMQEEYDITILERLDKRMQENRESVLNVFKRFVGHDLASHFAACVSLAYQEDCIEGINLAQIMGLTQSDIASLNDNLDAYRESLENENQYNYLKSYDI